MIRGCTDALQLLPDPHPSASQTPSPEGKAIRCGGGDLGGQGRMKPLPAAGMVVLVFCGEIPYNTYIIMAAECGKPESANMTEGEAWNRYRN